MSSFLKLRNTILNTRYIHHIDVYLDKYEFFTNGVTKGVIMFGSGSLSQDYDSFVVSKKKIKKIMTKLANGFLN